MVCSCSHIHCYFDRISSRLNEAKERGGYYGKERWISILILVLLWVSFPHGVGRFLPEPYKMHSLDMFCEQKNICHGESFFSKAVSLDIILRKSIRKKKVLIRAILYILNNLPEKVSNELSKVEGTCCVGQSSIGVKLVFEGVFEFKHSKEIKNRVFWCFKRFKTKCNSDVVYVCKN